MADQLGLWDVQPNAAGGIVTTQNINNGGGTVTPLTGIYANDDFVSDANPFPTKFTPLPLTAAGANAFEVTTGGDAVVAFAAESIVNGAYIINPPLAAQPIFVDAVNEAGTSCPGAQGTTEAIYPGNRWNAPGPLVAQVTVNAPDNNHPFIAVRF